MHRLWPWLLGFAMGLVVGWIAAPRGADAPLAPPSLEAAPPAAPEPEPSARLTAEGDPAGALRGHVGQEIPSREEARRPNVAKDGRVEVRVDVVFRDGSTPREAMVYWTHDPTVDVGQRWRSHWTPDSRSVWIQPGDVWLFAEAGLRGSFASPAERTRVSPEDPLQTVTLVLGDRPGVHGKVVLPEAFDRPRLQVFLVPYDGRSPLEELAFDPRGHRRTPTERDGYGFAFHDLPPGHYALGLSLGGQAIWVREAVEIASSMVERDLVLERFPPEEFLRVVVLGPDGAPLRDVQLNAHYRSDSLSSGGGNVELLRRDGVYLVSHNPSAKRTPEGAWPDGTYTLQARSRAHGDLVHVYDPNRDREIVLRYRPAGATTIRLLGYEGSPVEGRVLCGLRPAGTTGVTNPVRPGPDGAVVFPDRPPGRYELTFLGGLDGGLATLLWVKALEVPEGGGSVDVRVPAFHDLDVVLPEVAKQALRLTRTVGERWSHKGQRSSEGHRLRFGLLVEGTYLLEGRLGDRYIEREIQVPATRVVHLE